MTISMPTEKQIEAEDWSNALWCCIGLVEGCLAKVIAACICRQLPNNVYRAALEAAEKVDPALFGDGTMVP